MATNTIKIIMQLLNKTCFINYLNRPLVRIKLKCGFFGPAFANVKGITVQELRVHTAVLTKVVQRKH